MTKPQKNQSGDAAAEPTVIYVQAGSAAYASIIPAKPDTAKPEEPDSVER